MPTVLVIEDDATSARFMSLVLEREGFTVLMTEYPAEANLFCRSFKIDVIVADVVLRSPVSGTDIAIAIRQACPHIPVLFVSGTALGGWSDADFANIEALLPYEPINFLMKPFTARALAAAISTI